MQGDQDKKCGINKTGEVPIIFLLVRRGVPTTEQRFQILFARTSFSAVLNGGRLAANVHDERCQSSRMYMMKEARFRNPHAKGVHPDFFSNIIQV
jgi:hypothetical protein